jgi:hypothetical protein
MPITPELISQGRGPKATSIMTLDALNPHKGVLVLFCFLCFSFTLSASSREYGLKIINYSLQTLSKIYNMLLLFTVLKGFRGRDSNYTKHLKLWYILPCKQQLDS